MSKITPFGNGEKIYLEESLAKPTISEKLSGLWIDETLEVCLF
jgi:hypothetical protein